MKYDELKKVIQAADSEIMELTEARTKVGKSLQT